ncbi:MAG: hypothetical protein IJB90_05440 [Clostridia bacterium]|nr:hypothetical protein [Clostridia bacterium]
MLCPIKTKDKITKEFNANEETIIYESKITYIQKKIVGAGLALPENTKDKLNNT